MLQKLYNLCYYYNMEDLNYAKKVKELLTLPQSLCLQCGQCCNVSVFKGGLLYDEIIELINNPLSKESQVKGAKDYLSIFEPIPFEKAQELNYKFTVDILKKLGKTKEQVTFFHCKYLREDNKCSDHLNRPDLCRVYPVCYKDMFYYDGCGYAETARKNWAEIEKILKSLGADENTI